jgi:hypothetical protein
MHKPHPDCAYHHQINLFLSRLNEPQRRWFAALEAMRIGHGSKQLLAQITGLSLMTIRRDCCELQSGLLDCPVAQLRAPGGGRPSAEAHDPELEAAVETLLASETAGGPLGLRPKTKRSSLRTLSAKLNASGHPVSRMTVARLLREMDYSPKANARRTEGRQASPAQRDGQFRHIAKQREQFTTSGGPIISVDTKKELIGNFKNEGRKWCQTAEPVLVHDWSQDAIGQAVSYGVYDLRANRGYVCVGDCFDTPRIAVDAMSDWWCDEGWRRYG